MTPGPDLASVVARLEKENRNLVTRLEVLEKQKGSAVAGLIANAVLIVSAVLLVGYLGFFPAGIVRLPLEARTVDTNEIILNYRDSSAQARVVADSKGLHAFDDSGKDLLRRP
jgi:hypothetical protein